MSELAAYILDGLFALVVGVLLKLGVPYVKSLLTAKNLSFVSGWVDAAVAAAEQTIQGSGLGEQKKTFVIALLKKLNIAADDAVDALIEAAVKKMNDEVNAAASALTGAIKTASEQNV